MQPKEFAELVTDIKNNGLREPVWTYEGKIIDGRHRYLACREAGIEPNYREWDGKGSLILFVASLNQHRRHIDAGQRAMIAVEIEAQLAKEARQNQSIAGGDKKSENAKSLFQSFEKAINPSDISVEQKSLASFGTISKPTQETPKPTQPATKPIHAAKEAAKATGTNHQYVVDAKKIVDQAPELKPLVMDRTISLPDAKKLSSEPEETRKKFVDKIVSGEAKNVKEAKSIVRKEIAEEEAKTVILPKTMEIWHGDFTGEIGKKIVDNSVDLIFTDPPYHAEHLDLWSNLSKFASRVLKPGGILLSYSGQIFLPKVLNQLSENLTYCWLIGIAHTGGHIQIWKHTLWNDWKPIVMFSKGPPVEHDWFMDLYRGDKGDKEAHEWSQGEGEASYYIEKLTKPGQFVVDPMCGSGTILRAAHKLKRNCVGLEIDEIRHAIALSGMKELA
jgi:hypothetical protein